MIEEQTQTDHSLIVKESPTINFILATVFLLMFIGSLFSIEYLSGSALLYPCFFAFFAFLFFAQGMKKSILMEINGDGIFYRRELITDWNNFVNAYITEAEIPGSLKDTFLLVVQYYVPSNGKEYIRNLKMTDSQDRSEEDIMTAINYFSKK